MPKFRRIGAGFCGTSSTSAFKREDGGPGRSLANDFEMHNIMRVPQCHRFITADDDAWWAANLANFPEGYSPCNVIHSERIPPMSRRTREILIQRYCPESLVEEIKGSDANRDCLIRPYLALPKIMAEALAMMHWYGEIDANEVEFVPAPPSPPPPSSSSSSSFSSGPSPVINNILGPHVMRTLDFDCRRKMSIDEKGIEQAVTAFSRNDPFYPRPGPGGRGGGEEGSSQPLSLSLWTAFQDRYLQTSDATIRSSSSSSSQIGDLIRHQRQR
ncbi:zinc finger protein-domain-containing protein [Thermoascus aurantiacus ATCC 26904]